MKIEKQIAEAMRAFGFVVLTTAAACAFTACGDDDEANDTAGEDQTSQDSGPQTEAESDAVFVYKTVGGYTFDYDEKGRCIKTNNCDIDYDKGTIIYPWGNVSTDTYTATFNADGYATSIDDGREKATFAYDSTGHLTKVCMLGGRDMSGTVEMDFIWENGNLVESTHRNLMFNKEREMSYKFKYSNLPNKSGRYTDAFTDYFISPFRLILSGSLPWLPLAGVLGKGPANLPAAYYGGGQPLHCDYGYDHTVEVSYELDASGLPLQEKWSGTYITRPMPEFGMEGGNAFDISGSADYQYIELPRH